MKKIFIALIVFIMFIVSSGFVLAVDCTGIGEEECDEVEDDYSSAQSSCDIAEIFDLQDFFNAGFDACCDSSFSEGDVDDLLCTCIGDYYEGLDCDNLEGYMDYIDLLNTGALDHCPGLPSQDDAEQAICDCVSNYDPCDIDKMNELKDILNSGIFGSSSCSSGSSWANDLQNDIDNWECSPPETQNEDCEPPETGSRTRDCMVTCQWSLWSSCDDSCDPPEIPDGQGGCRCPICQEDDGQGGCQSIDCSDVDECTENERCENDVCKSDKVDCGTDTECIDYWCSPLLGCGQDDKLCPSKDCFIKTGCDDALGGCQYEHIVCPDGFVEISNNPCCRDDNGNGNGNGVPEFSTYGIIIGLIIIAGVVGFYIRKKK
ncbi:hypothetical protein GOV06_01845 [Candidatus Woesearchaeota archaeon]|nr:hypothetical protein [Candidatus Woesearchaeota archaeon]